MEASVYAPWKQIPFHLSLEEVQRPLSVLEEFFYIKSPGGHFKFLKDWRHYVLFDQFFNDKSDGPGYLWFEYKWHIKLLEALSLLADGYKKERYKFPPVPGEQLTAEERKWEWFPKELAREELADPYLAIHKVFKKISLPQFREYLADWLEAALSKQDIDESVTPGEVVKVYESLQKLYSAAWLIRQRHGDKDSELNEDSKDTILTVPAGNEAKGSSCKALNGLYPALTDAERLGMGEVCSLILKKVPTVKKIVLLGTHPKPFTYYLVIIIDDTDKTQEHEIANKIEDNCKQLVGVFAIVERESWVKHEIERGDRFWNTALYHGVHVHTADGFELPAFQSVGKDAWIKSAKTDWKRWGEQGLGFLKAAKLAAENENFNLAVFMLHQAAESSIIGIVRVLSGCRFSTHNLARMLKFTLLFTDTIVDVLELEDTENARKFALLQSGYSEARYNATYTVDKASVVNLTGWTEALLKTIEMDYLRVTLGLAW